jgi:hypothetical protein
MKVYSQKITDELKLDDINEYLQLKLYVLLIYSFSNSSKSNTINKL